MASSSIQSEYRAAIQQMAKTGRLSGPAHARAIRTLGQMHPRWQVWELYDALARDVEMQQARRRNPASRVEAITVRDQQGRYVDTVKMRVTETGNASHDGPMAELGGFLLPLSGHSGMGIGGDFSRRYVKAGPMVLEAAGLAGHRHNPRGTRRNPRGRFSHLFNRSTAVESLLFPRVSYTVQQAKAWARREGFRSSEVEPVGPSAKYLHLRQLPPGKVKARTFRTIVLGDGVKAIVGVPDESLVRQGRDLPRDYDARGPERRRRDEKERLARRARGRKRNPAAVPVAQGLLVHGKPYPNPIWTVRSRSRGRTVFHGDFSAEWLAQAAARAVQTRLQRAGKQKQAKTVRVALGHG